MGNEVAQDDWFRKTTWSDSDARGFSTRLHRSRSNFHKSQYLRIQAYTLAETGSVTHAHVALGLLDRLFAEFPDSFELSLAHLLAAQCQERLGNTAKALEHLEWSLHAQANCPNRRSGVSLEYPWFVARHDLADHFEAAKETLKSANLAFPATAFKAAATRAFIAHAQRDPAAAHYASEALQAAALEESQFHYHRKLGLVGENYATFIKRLRGIVQKPTSSKPSL